jgi:hypothetical protein
VAELTNTASVLWPISGYDNCRKGREEDSVCSNRPGKGEKGEGKNRAKGREVG